MEKVLFQEYIVELSNGLLVPVHEEFDKPFDKGLIRQYEKADDNKLFVFGNEIDGFLYVPKKNIICIMTGDVVEGEKWNGG